MRRSCRFTCAVFAALILLVGISMAEVPCSEMPDKMTQVNRDVQADFKLEIDPLGKLKVGQLGAQAGIVAKNLFDKYPNLDKLIVVQIMAATYCGMLRDSKTLKEPEKLQLWSEFTDRVFKFTNPDYKPTPPKPTHGQKTQQHPSHPGAPRESSGQDIKSLVNRETQSKLSELDERFPGGFQTFVVVVTGSATEGHGIIRTPASDFIDVTWKSAAIKDVTPASLTLELQDVTIERTEVTPNGTQPAGKFQMHGSAIWLLDRRSKAVNINNAISFWGYVLGGLVLSDTGDVLVVAVGLQRVQ